MAHRHRSLLFAACLVAILALAAADDTEATASSPAAAAPAQKQEPSEAAPTSASPSTGTAKAESTATSETATTTASGKAAPAASATATANASSKVHAPSKQQSAEQPWWKPASPAAAATAVAAPATKGDINASGACKEPLLRLCSNVKRGRGRQAHCLRNELQAARERKEEPLTVACVDEIHNFFIKGLRNGSLSNPVQGFRKACRKDIAQFCPGQQGPALTVCLKAMKRRGSLRPNCNKKVFQLQHEESKLESLDIQFMDVCNEDLRRWKCMQANEVDGKKLCLGGHVKNLTSKCASLMFQRLQDNNEDVRLHHGLYKACRKEISSVCGTTSFGEARVLHCLWDEMEGATFGSECKTWVTNVTRLRVSDYRLDYRIRTRCASDITRLCEEEKRFVDSLSIAEHRMRYETGKSGKVIQCLKANYRDITAPACQGEIKSLIKVHARDWDSDRTFFGRCKADIQRFCNTTASSRVHHCLRLRLNKLSPTCKAAELLQGSLASMEIELKPEMSRNCAVDITKHCSHSQKRNAEVIQCLQDKLEEERLSRSCSESVEADLEASNRDWRLKFGIHQSCRTEAERLCVDADRNVSGSILQCLKNSSARIANAACKGEIFRYIRQGAYSVKFNPHVSENCMDDVTRHCSTVQPGQGRVHECLLRHKSELSPECAKAEFQLQKQQAQDIRTHPKAMKLCRKSMSLLCSEVPPEKGRKWECLMQHKDDERMSEGCRAVVGAQTRLSNFHFELDPTLTRYCAKAAQKRCPVEVALAKSKPFGNEGAVIGCLIHQRRHIQNFACKAKLATKAAQRLANIENDPTASMTCRGDVETFCADVEAQGHGELHKCLQQHIANLSAPCRLVEVEYGAMEAEDLRLMAWMKNECGAARRRYCQHVEEGAHVAVCMLQNMHRDSMEPGCRQKLVDLQKLRATDIRFNPLLAKECQSDLIRIQQNHPAQAECAPQEEENIALSGLNVRCLTQHRKEVKRSDCRTAILSVLRQESNDLRAKPGMEQACAKDIARLCKETEAGKGRLHACLRRNTKRIHNKECLAMVAEVKKAEKEDATISPRIRARCSHEMEAFCAKVEHGESRVLTCLRREQGHPDFSSGCKEELEHLGFNATKGMKAGGTELSSQEATNVLSSLLRERNFWAKWAPLVMGGTAVLLVAIFVGGVVLVMYLRRGPPEYGIEVQQAEKDYP